MGTQKALTLCLISFLVASGLALTLGNGQDMDDVTAVEDEGINARVDPRRTGTSVQEGIDDQEEQRVEKVGMPEESDDLEVRDPDGPDRSYFQREVASTSFGPPVFTREQKPYSNDLGEYEYSSDQINKNRFLTDGADHQKSARPEGNYTNHTTIRIDGNYDLDQTAQSEGWPGNGSEENPYIIEGYEIDGEGKGYCIYVGNVTDHFVIEDCYLHNASGKNVKYAGNTGLFLLNVTAGRVENNTLLYNQNGIVVRSSQEVTVLENTVEAPFDQQDSFLPFESKAKPSDVRRREEAVNWKDGKEYSSESVLVKLESDMVQRKLEQGGKELLNKETDSLAKQIGGSTSRIFEHIGAAQIKVAPDTEVMEAVKRLNQRSAVEYAEPNYHVDIKSMPNDPGFGSLWGMQKVDSRDAWNVSKGSGDVVIAVIDTGVDYNHPDLKENIWTGTTDNGTEYHGYNAVNETYCPMDDHGHGTHVAGTIGAVGNNNRGVVGMNWNVSVMPVKFLDSGGGGTTADAIECFEFVLEKKQEGVNMIATSNSWGGGGKSKLMKEAIAEHRDAGILCIAAAGNDWSNNDVSPSYPANYDVTNVVSVAATDEEDELAYFSNYGNRSVHVAAPGVDINSTLPGGEYGEYSGTSMATPHVSGLAGLLAASNSSYDYNELKNILLSSVDSLEGLKNKTMSGGRINASRALNVSSEPGEVNFRIHRPLSSPDVGEDVKMMISLDNDVEPIAGKNVTVRSSFDKETFHLKDNGTGADQIPDDGYYTASWTPTTSGEINLTVIVELKEGNITRELSLDIWGDTGVSVQNSSHCVVDNINVTQYDIGVSVSSSNDISLLENNASSNQQGFASYRSSSILMADNSVFGNDKGLYLEESWNNTISENHVLKNGYGIDLQRSRNNSVLKNNITAQWVGIQVLDSPENDLAHNQLTDDLYGIGIVRSQGCRFVDNQIDSKLGDMWYGVVMSQSNKTLVEDNSVNNNSVGIAVLDCGGSEIYNNSLSTSIDITIEESIRTDMLNNTMRKGVYMKGPKRQHWASHSIDVTNTINGTPIYYWKNRTDVDAPEDTRQIILVNCRDVDITDLDLNSSSYTPVLGAFSEEITVSNNEFSNSMYGLDFTSSENCTVKDNNFSYFDGFALQLNMCLRTTVVNNSVYRNEMGIQALRGDEIFIHNNTISYTYGKGLINGYDIDLTLCENSTVSDNFIHDNFGSGSSIFMGGSLNNDIIGNHIRYNADRGNGIYLGGSKNNHVAGNMIDRVGGLFRRYKNYNNGNGIYLSFESVNNTIFNNTIHECLSAGIQLGNKYFGRTESDNNLLYCNNLLDNERQANDNCENQWYNGTTGNYWSDYEKRYPNATVMADKGVWDTPYNITRGDNFDEYPLTEPSIPVLSIDHPTSNEFLNETNITVRWTTRYMYGSDLELEYRIDNGGWTYLGVKNHHNFTDLSDGYHEISVRVIGHEQFSHDTVGFRKDAHGPEIYMIYPKLSREFSQDYVDIDWEGVSNVTAIDHYEVKINGENWTDVGTQTEYNLTDLEDGNYTFMIRARDFAGNRAEKELSLLIDTSPPEVNLTNPGKDGVVKNEEVELNWESSDNVSGILLYRISIDDRNPKLVEDDREAFRIGGLKDGQHTVILEAIDELQNTANTSVNFTLDTTRPELEISRPIEGREFEVDDVEVEWNCSDEVTGVDHYEVQIDGGGWRDVKRNRSLLFEGLDDGNHTVVIRASDVAGNEVIENISFTVNEAHELRGTVQQEPITDWWVMGFVLSSLVLFLLMVVYIVKLNGDMSSTHSEKKLEGGMGLEEDITEEREEGFLDEDDISSKRRGTEEEELSSEEREELAEDDSG